MENGKYILLSVKELKEKVSSYLNINFEFITEKTEDNIMLLRITRLDIEKIDTLKLFLRLYGENGHQVVKFLSDYPYVKDVCFSMSECSCMLKNIFKINEDITFGDETFFTNNGEKIYLFYKDNR